MASKTVTSPSKKVRVKLFQQPTNTKELGKPSLRSDISP